MATEHNDTKRTVSIVSEMMHSIHVFHGNLGGSGKTLCAALFADHCRRRGLPIRCFDSESTWAGLSQYPSLQVKRLWSADLSGREAIDFDPVFEPAPGLSILDCGPEGYYAFLRYIEDNQLDQDCRWVLHVPLTRARLDDGKAGFERLRKHWPPLVVLWLNAYQHGAFTFEEAVTVLGLSKDLAVRAVNMAGREFNSLETSLDSSARGRTLSEVIEATRGMSLPRLRRCQDVLDDRLEQLSTMVAAGGLYVD